MVASLEWIELDVCRDKRFESLETKLCASKAPQDPNTIFKTVKELMVFAALVGHQLDKFEPLLSKANSGGVTLGTFSKTKHDAYIYLLALAKNPSLDLLKEEKLKEAISIFEAYCNAGLKHIDNWVMNNIGESILTNVLFNKTLEHLQDVEVTDINSFV